MNFQSLEDLYINFVLFISILFILNCINLNNSFMFCQIKLLSKYLGKIILMSPNFFIF